MFRPLLAHHQASYKKTNYLNCVVLIWIHILESVIIIIIIIIAMYPWEIKNNMCKTLVMCCCPKLK
jgi:hypothetical protein